MPQELYIVYRLPKAVKLKLDNVKGWHSRSFRIKGNLLEINGRSTRSAIYKGIPIITSDNFRGLADEKLAPFSLAIAHESRIPRDALVGLDQYQQHKRGLNREFWMLNGLVGLKLADDTTRRLELERIEAETLQLRLGRLQAEAKQGAAAEASTEKAASPTEKEDSEPLELAARDEEQVAEEGPIGLAPEVDDRPESATSSLMLKAGYSEAEAVGLPAVAASGVEIKKMWASNSKDGSARIINLEGECGGEPFRAVARSDWDPGKETFVVWYRNRE